MTGKKTRIVVALGGNAILREGQEGSYEEQFKSVEDTSRVIGEAILSGEFKVAVTHGNGPQIGAILLQNYAGESEGVPSMPMDVCGAQSQGMIGYMLQQCLGDVFREAEADIPVATVVTQSVVDEEDSAFKNPSKPVGPFYSKIEAEELFEERGWRMVKASGKGWRRVVPSPEPKDIVEKDAISELYRVGVVPIVSGGGGIPVVEKGGSYVGKEAVIDKDLAAEKICEVLAADVFVMLTDVRGAALNYGESEEEWIEEATCEEMRGYMDEGHFTEGSMKPKVKASISFLEKTGDMAVISSLKDAESAIKGESGTIITN